MLELALTFWEGYALLGLWLDNDGGRRAKGQEIYTPALKFQLWDAVMIMSIFVTTGRMKRPIIIEHHRGCGMWENGIDE